MVTHPKQIEADHLEITVEELLELEKYREDEAEAAMLGIEIWELRMRQSNASDAEIEAHRAKLWRKIQECIGM